MAAPRMDAPMDFGPADAQLAAREATASALAPWDTPTGAAVSDWRPVWHRLVAAGLVGLAQPDAGGSGVEAIEVLIGLGRRALHVPLLAPTALLPMLTRSPGPAADTWLDAVAGGSAIVSAVVGEVGVDRLDRTQTRARAAGDALRISGMLIAVPFVGAADRLLVVVRSEGVSGAGLVLVAPTAPGVTATPSIGTTGEAESTVVLTDVEVPASDVIVAPGADDGAAVREYEQRLLVATAAEQLGLAETALQLTAHYTSTREQFGRPIATFQAVSARAADAFIDLVAMRWTLYKAVTLLADGEDATTDTAIAKFWAAEAGGRVMAAAAHLHGGVGVDTSYPLHRFYLRSRQLELALGGAGGQLARIWEAIERGGV